MADRPRTSALKRVSDEQPGLSRKKTGSGFAYYRADGTRVRSAADLARIRTLAIPPAWTDVWICRDARGHIQATGRDARGRKQYRYHPSWSRTRDTHKYDRMLAFARSLPAIRRQVSHHLALKGLQRERALAAVVRLLDLTSIRVGNSEYARDNNSFGLTTLRRKHVSVKGDLIALEFTGKGSKRHAIEIADRRVATVVRECLALPGLEIFKYVNDGRVVDVTAADVNDYLRRISRDEFSAKDFRTWTATVMVVLRLLGLPPSATRHQRKGVLLDAIDIAAERLGNTRAICRKSYVHPTVQHHYLERGTLGRARPPRNSQVGTRRGDAVALNVVKALARQPHGTMREGRSESR